MTGHRTDIPGDHPTDTRFMQRAIELARLAEGQTRPNPLVGAVIVRDGFIIAEGFHARAGEPHAERVALAAASADPRGATMYVTLEPCNHHGRTPPCTDAILAAGIARVVIAQRDPNPLARGGVERLRQAGVEVTVGVLAPEARMLNPAFNIYHREGRPLVMLKWAMSADGCTSCHGGASAWITGPAARARGHALRAAHDAVAIGVETALRDNARLTIRDAPVPPGPPLKRLVLDTDLRLPPDHPLVTADQGEAWVACAGDAPVENERRLLDAGAHVVRVRRAKEGRGISVPDLIRHLYDLGVQSLYVEGGRTVAGAFLRSGFADRIAAFIAPLVVGAGESPLSALVLPEPPRTMDAAHRLHHPCWTVVGEDVLLEAWLSGHLFRAGGDGDGG